MVNRRKAGLDLGRLFYLRGELLDVAASKGWARFGARDGFGDVKSGLFSQLAECAQAHTEEQGGLRLIDD